TTIYWCFQSSPDYFADNKIRKSFLFRVFSVCGSDLYRKRQQHAVTARKGPAQRHPSPRTEAQQVRHRRAPSS
ncbi:hypothetical protein ATANTOWER_031305, partial [Ataeniobius toweri]|nr:hypothetical protein [Ataeniobius toweri]